MPISSDLRHVCKRLRIRKLGELSQISEKDIRQVFKKTSLIISEIEVLIQLARTAYASPRLAGALKYASVAKLSNQNDQSVEGKTIRQGEGSLINPAVATRDIIFVPVGERGRSLGTVQLSVRLRHILDAKQIRILGDLNGLDYEEIKEYQNCGRRTIIELREIIRQLQLGSTDSSLGPAISEPVNNSTFVVPSHPGKCSCCTGFLRKTCQRADPRSIQRLPC